MEPRLRAEKRTLTLGGGVQVAPLPDPGGTDIPKERHLPMAYVLKRLLLMIPTLLIITMVSWVVMLSAPGDPVRSSIMGTDMGGEGGGVGELKEGVDESQAAIVFRRRFNLDLPWYQSYWIWMFGTEAWEDDDGVLRPKTYGVIRGDFGVSITVSRSKPVMELLAERLPVTIKLNLLSMLVVYLVAIPAGIYSAVYRNSLLDRVSSLVFFVLYSLPSFWIGLLLIMAVSRWIPWWPTSGIRAGTPLTESYWNYLLESMRYYVLPVICLSYGGFAGLSRFSRVGMLDVVSQDYIRTARAKGLPERVVIFKHALRNSLIPLVTIFAGLLPSMIGGSIIIEYLFSIPGMGQLSLDALGSRDYPVVITIFGFSAVLTLIGILISDILYSLVDPRIRLD